MTSVLSIVGVPVTVLAEITSDLLCKLPHPEFPIHTLFPLRGDTFSLLADYFSFEKGAILAFENLLR